MKLKAFIREKGLKYLIVSLACLFILLFASMNIAGNLFETECMNRLGKLSEEFSGIGEELEFNGFSDTVTKKIKDYSSYYSQKVNVIITDKQGNVIYSLNKAYMPETDRFCTVYTLNSAILDVIDSQQKVRYTAALDYSLNRFSDDGTMLINGNIELIANSVVMPESIGNTGSYSLDEKTITEAYRIKIQKLESLSRQPSLYMICMSIQSKGYSLYSVSQYNLTKLVKLDQSLSVYNVMESILEPILAVILFLYWLLLPVWVFADAHSRGFKAPLWTLVTLLTNLVGLIVYLVVRPEYTVCARCGRHLSEFYVICPFCGRRNKEQCASCGRVLEEEWAACPDCGRFKTNEPSPEVSQPLSIE